MLVPLPPPRLPVLPLRTSASRTTAVGTPGDERGSSSPVPAHEAKPPAAAGRQGCPLPPPTSAAPLPSTGSAPGIAGRKHCTWKQNQRDRGPDPRGSGRHSAPSSWVQRHRPRLWRLSGALRQAQQGWPAAAGLCSEPAAPSHSLKNNPASPLLSHGSQQELGQGAHSIAQLAPTPRELVQLREPMPFQLQDWGQLHQRVPLRLLSSHLCVCVRARRFTPPSREAAA